MVTIRTLYKVLTPLFLLLGVSPAQAADLSDLNFIGQYHFSWDGISLASAELAITEDRDSYSVHLALVSEGVVKLFTRHRSDTVVFGRREGGHYHPKVYESHYWTKDKPRHIKLAFNALGVITEETVEPPENRKERPEVPHAQKDGTLDPLTFLRALSPDNLTAKVFDAKHLWQSKTTVMPLPADTPTHVGNYEVRGYALARVPLAGMTQKETRDYNKGEPPLYLLITADNRHVPVYLYMSLYLGNLRGLLTKECKTWDECKLN